MNIKNILLIFSVFLLVYAIYWSYKFINCTCEEEVIKESESSEDDSKNCDNDNDDTMIDDSKNCDTIVDNINDTMIDNINDSKVDKNIVDNINDNIVDNIVDDEVEFFSVNEDFDEFYSVIEEQICTKLKNEDCLFLTLLDEELVKYKDRTFLKTLVLSHYIMYKIRKSTIKRIMISETEKFKEDEVVDIYNQLRGVRRELFMSKSIMSLFIKDVLNKGKVKHLSEYSYFLIRENTHIYKYILKNSKGVINDEILSHLTERSIKIYDEYISPIELSFGQVMEYFIYITHNNIEN